MKFLLFTFFSMILLSCSSPVKTTEVKTGDSTDVPLKWPSGQFLYKEEGGTYIEEWRKMSENEYTGTGRYLSSNEDHDTLFSMSMRLVNKNGNRRMYFLVKGQNNDQETEFTLTKEEGNTFVFENPFRDFPSIMQYSMSGDTAFSVLESGFDKNQVQKTRKYRVHKAG